MRNAFASLAAAALLSGCATIPKDIPPTCDSAANHADKAQMHQRNGAAGLALGLPIAIAAGALGGIAVWSATEAATVNPTHVIIQKDGDRVNALEYHTDVATGTAVGGGVATGFAIGFNIAGGVNLGLGRLQAGFAERDLDHCLEDGAETAPTHRVQQVLEGGAWIVLDDGSAHRVPPESVTTAAGWEPGEPLLLRDGLIFNEARAEGVRTITEDESETETTPDMEWP